MFLIPQSRRCFSHLIPSLVKAPELEFATGFTGTFSSKGHSKAKGVELTVRYPLSWKQFEADRPNIVQKWTSDGGHGTDIFMVQVRKFPAIPTPQESAELFTESFAKEMFEDGGKTLSYTTGRLERLPPWASFILRDHEAPRP